MNLKCVSRAYNFTLTKKLCICTDAGIVRLFALYFQNTYSKLIFFSDFSRDSEY